MYLPYHEPQANGEEKNITRQKMIKGYVKINKYKMNMISNIQQKSGEVLMKTVVLLLFV